MCRAPRFTNRGRVGKCGPSLRGCSSVVRCKTSSRLWVLNGQLSVSSLHPSRFGLELLQYLCI
eukprot:5491663-Amphidinium_carterae.1